MRKEDKNTIIAHIADTVKEYGHFYLVDVTAMNAAATSELRRACFKAGIKLMLVKNTLLHKALDLWKKTSLLFIILWLALLLSCLVMLLMHLLN